MGGTIDAGTTRHAEQRCPHCHHLLSAASAGDTRTIATAGPGDISVCIECSGVMMFGPTMILRAVSADELLKLFADDPEWHNEVRAMVQKIQMMPWFRRPTA